MELVSGLPTRQLIVCGQDRTARNKDILTVIQDGDGPESHQAG